VDLFLQGRGKAWFDNVYFGPARCGAIAGVVTADGQPQSDVRVFLWGDPWGKRYEAFTDSGGTYRLDGVPIAFPRYVLLTSKHGYRTRPAGDITIIVGRVVNVDLQMERGQDPDDLHVKFGTLVGQSFRPGPRIPDGATIPPDATDYPAEVRTFLQPDAFITSDHPSVIAEAQRIVDRARRGSTSPLTCTSSSTVT
jgi:hypothetical protein